METRTTRFGLAAWATLVVLFLWTPLVLICVYAFNSSNIQSWPIAGFSTKWFRAAWENQDARDALVLSLKAAGLATIVALGLGTAAERDNGGEDRKSTRLNSSHVSISYAVFCLKKKKKKKKTSSQECTQNT